MATVIKLMPDYHTSPLWIVEPESDNLELDEVPITSALRRDLDAWADEFDTRLNFDDPAASRDISEEESLGFERRRVDLWRRLRAELPPDYVIHYQGAKYDEEFAADADLPRELRST
jgi:hypothetical protein